MHNHAAGLRVIHGAKAGTSLDDEQSPARSDQGFARLFSRSPEVVFAVLMRRVAGNIAAAEYEIGAPSAGPIDLRKAVRSLRVRVSDASVDGDERDPETTTWVITGSSAPSSITLGVAGGDASDVIVHCAIEDDGSGSTKLALSSEVTHGSIFGRGARRRRADELCQEFLSTASMAVIRYSGNTPPRGEPREFARGSALLLANGATFRGELCDMSAGGISATIPRHALGAETPGGGYSLQSVVGTSGTLVTRLERAHVTVSVRIVHVWPVAHGLRVGMQLG